MLARLTLHITFNICVALVNPVAMRSLKCTNCITSDSACATFILKIHEDGELKGHMPSLHYCKTQFTDC